MLDCIHEEERDGFTIRFFAMPEIEDPADCFFYDGDEEIIQKIHDGYFEWFMAKVTASKAGVELGADYLGACCYENAREFVADPYYEDMVSEALKQARNTIQELTN